MNDELNPFLIRQHDPDLPMSLPISLPMFLPIFLPIFSDTQARRPSPRSGGGLAAHPKRR